MTLGVRGSNPIWTEFDLQGNLFDDTFYMFVLENTIPYIPATVYHDPNLNIPWTNPIQFLGNGTLPIDIFFEVNHVYRLEFRQGNTQADPLIYEVNNYTVGSSGDTPIDIVAFGSSNQITNPQFALTSFNSPLTISGTDPDPIQVGPGWYLEVAGTGTVVLTKVPLTDTNINPSNAPYALQLTLSGWTADSVFLRQRFDQNGMLWARQSVSSSITAQLSGAPQAITATLVDSNDALLGVVLSETVNESWNEFTGRAELPETTNPDTPPAAYIDYRLALPSNIDIYVTSIQLIVQDVNDLSEPAFEQDSINRQIDHTYNTAYPIVPVGTVIDFFGFGIPAHYLNCNGQALNRVVYNLLFQAMTVVETVTLTDHSTTFVVVSSADYWIGMKIEGTGIPAATTIAGITGTTITMSAQASATGPSAVRFFAAGAGNGTTTFNAPDLRDYVTAGVGGSLFGSGANGIGKLGGGATNTLSGANLPAHTHTIANGSIAGAVNSVTSGNHTLSTDLVTGNGPGSATAFSIVQQTALVRKCIRFE